MHNKLDWCVRGFSYGVYNRGRIRRDSRVRTELPQHVCLQLGDPRRRRILPVGRSATMDTGEGGCNDNVVFATTSAIRRQMGSRRRSVKTCSWPTRCWSAGTGVWGGYSFDSKIIGNRFGFNGEAISIEHGQDNVISLNRFTRDTSGIGIWQAPITDRNWAYPKHHDTASHSYVIRNNRFLNISGSGISLRKHDRRADRPKRVRAGFRRILKNSSISCWGTTSSRPFHRPCDPMARVRREHAGCRPGPGFFDRNRPQHCLLLSTRAGGRCSLLRFGYKE